MKLTSSRILVTCACAVAAFSAFEMASSQTSRTSPSDDPVEDTRVEALREASKTERAIQRMNKRAAEVSRRVGMASSFDANETTDPSTGVDIIKELSDSGVIVPATLEEVEAALAAAALTPETDDDKAALILKHRGSYRFFLND